MHIRTLDNNRADHNKNKHDDPHHHNNIQYNNHTRLPLSPHFLSLDVPWLLYIKATAVIVVDVHTDEDVVVTVEVLEALAKALELRDCLESAMTCEIWETFVASPICQIEQILVLKPWSLDKLICSYIYNWNLCKKNIFEASWKFHHLQR